MEALLRLAATLGRLAPAERLHKAAWCTVMVSLCFGLGALAAAAALGCGLAALWLALLPHIGPLWSPVVVAGVLALAAAALLALGTRRLGKPSRRPLPQAASGAAIAGEMARILLEHKGSLLLAAFIAGLLSSNNRRRR